MRILILVLATLILISCENKIENQKSNYSKKFYETITNSDIELRHDSLLFPVESGIEEPILIPTILNLEKEYTFLSKNGLELILKRINFTDIEFKLNSNGNIESGLGSLRPTFYLGTESIETSEGEFWVNDYDVEDSKTIRTIKIGNEGLSDEIVEDIYLYIITKPNCDIEKLVEINELWKLKNE